MPPCFCGVTEPDARAARLGPCHMALVCAASKDEQGMYINTEDTDCEQCKCDLYLSAIVSSACPGKAACPEHASCLPCAPSSWILLYRYVLDLWISIAWASCLLLLVCPCLPVHICLRLLHIDYGKLHAGTSCLHFHHLL